MIARLVLEMFQPPPGTPGWGSKWKQAVAHYYNRTLQVVIFHDHLSCRDNYMDLDPKVGGAMAGSTPENSAVNKYMQSWDVPNLFVVGASAFPQITAYTRQARSARRRISRQTRLSTSTSRALARWCPRPTRGPLQAAHTCGVRSRKHPAPVFSYRVDN